MGFYTERILPYLMDRSLSSPTLAPYRQALLSDVQGRILEIGFGTGLNLPYYPPEIRRIATVDANPGIHKLAQTRIQASPITVDHHILSGERLPMAENSFDSVVSTFTLCSIADVEQALQEIHRVLKPGGRFFFVEHGLSNEPRVQVWQNRLTPLQKIIAGGCHLNRNIQQIVGRQFSTVTLEAAYAENLPKITAYLYQGVATKAN
jgi:ubiquinone/menaquinone biosynthesis C-methylase UbiE